MLRVYRSLLRLYPAVYRREFGDEMSVVFAEAEQDAVSGKFGARLSFRARELAGLFSGAVREHLRNAFDGAGWSSFRRFDMRPEFRFPRSTVFLMWVILAGVVLAIHKAKAVVAMNEGLRMGTVAVWDPLFWLSPLAVVLAIVGAVWGILFALGRTGMQRLSNVETEPGRQ